MEPNERLVEQLLKDNTRLQQELDYYEKKHGRWAKIKRAIGKRVGYIFMGRGLVRSFNRLYGELPNRVTKDTFADLSAHLVWRITRIGIFTIMIAVIPLLVLLVQTIILNKTNQLSEQQNDLFALQIQQLDKQNELILGQNTLFREQNQLFANQNKSAEKQNTLVKGQNLLVDNQNELVSLQNGLFGNQNQLVGQQNKLVGQQNRRIEQQTELLEADRRSSLVFLMGHIMDKVDEELKKKKNRKERSLSFELMGRISALSQSLKPYRYLQNDKLIERPLSPERGQLFLSLVNSQLNIDSTLSTIYANTHFDFCDLQEAVLINAYMAKVKMPHASLYASNFTDAVLAEADLASADLRYANLTNADCSDSHLLGAEMQHALFSNANLSKARLMDAQLDNANMRGVNLSGAYLDGASLRDVDLTNALLANCRFNKVDLTRAELSGAVVSSGVWFYDLKDWGVKGVDALQKKYELQENNAGLWVVMEKK